MNYIWELMLQADKEGIARTDIHLINAQNPSPYIEISMEELNVKEIEENTVEVNPLYRFPHELGKLFSADISGFEKTRELFLDICFHYIAQLDLREGLSRKDFYISSMLEDFDAGRYGIRAEEGLYLFDRGEAKQLMSYYLYLIKTGNYLAAFRRAVKNVYPHSLIYENNDRTKEIFVYLGVEDTENEQKRIKFLTMLFLPIQEEVQIFYNHHFGIIGIDETMEVDEMMLV